MTNPESDVLSAIDALERDEIGELVTWQIEQGRARGDGPCGIWAIAERLSSIGPVAVRVPRLTEEESARLNASIASIQQSFQRVAPAMAESAGRVTQAMARFAAAFNGQPYSFGESDDPDPVS